MRSSTYSRTAQQVSSLPEVTGLAGVRQELVRLVDGQEDSAAFLASYFSGDRELVEKAKKGDQGAFEQLVLDNQNRVYSLALRLLGDREEAADLAQEAFVKAWQGLSSFQGESSFSTWVYRLTTNVCIDHLRKKKRREAVEPAVSLDDEDSGWAEPADWEGDPQKQLERSERGKALARALYRIS